jgi:hypothetical protein
MPRFYFHLTSKDSRIPDESGKELNTLNDAYVYARNLIDKILFHVGYDDAEAWKVIISNDSYEAQMIVPFPMSYSHRAHLQSESNIEVVVCRDSHRDKSDSGCLEAGDGLRCVEAQYYPQTGEIRAGCRRVIE